MEPDAQCIFIIYIYILFFDVYICIYIYVCMYVLMRVLIFIFADACIEHALFMVYWHVVCDVFCVVCKNSMYNYSCV